MELPLILETHAVFGALDSALDTHVHALLDATTFGIDQLEIAGERLRMVYGVEASQPHPSIALRMDNQFKTASHWCNTTTILRRCTVCPTN